MALEGKALKLHLKVICHYPSERLVNQCTELEAAPQCQHLFQISWISRFSYALLFIFHNILFSPISSTNGVLIPPNAFRWTRHFCFLIKKIFCITSLTCVYNLLKNTFAKVHSYLLPSPSAQQRKVS